MDNLNRREFLATVPALAITPSLLASVEIPLEKVRLYTGHQFQNDFVCGWPIIQHAPWIGPFADNVIDPNWAELVFAKSKYELEDFTNITISRAREECWLNPENASYFTGSAPETNYLWFGVVILVHDVIWRRDGHMVEHIYPCRTKISTRDRLLLPGEKPPEKWIHLG